MRIRRILALVLTGILLFGLCACGGDPGDRYDVSTATQMREEKQVYLTVWSWQVASLDDAVAYAQKAKDSGFTAIDFGVLWAKFEPLKGHFDWSYLDGVVQTFTDAGLKISLQPLLWSRDLSWAHDLSLQEMKSRKVYSVEGRGSFLSLTDSKTLSIMENTLQNFALHASETYGANLTRWGVRLSCFGEFDYSVNEDLDYSGSSARAFYDYLKDVYGTWGNLAQLRGLPISSRSDLDAMALDDVVSACSGDWRRFRQETLFDVLDSVTKIYRSVDKTVPILLSLGTYGNGMNTAYSGVVDLWSALEEHDVDIVGLSFCDGADGDMMLSLVSSLTTKKIAVEVDGAWALEEGRDVASQVGICGKYGIFSVSTANFTLEQLDAHKEVLKTYQNLFAATGTGSESVGNLGDRDPSRAILILSNALAEGNPPRSYDALYGDAWKALSENGTRRVRFVTEGQIASGEISLEGVTTLYVGNINGSLPVSRAFADAVSKRQVTIRGAVSFVSLDGSPLPKDVASALQSRVSAE